MRSQVRKVNFPDLKTERESVPLRDGNLNLMNLGEIPNRVMTQSFWSSF